MMKTKITTLKELRDERKLSAVRLRSAEANLVESFNELKDELRPVGKIVYSVSNLFSSDHENLLSKSVGFALNGILKNGIFRNAGIVTKYGLSFLATTIAKNYVSKNAGSILDWVGALLKKKDNDHNSNGRSYDASTVHSESDIY